jgi:hypothetical protein
MARTLTIEDIQEGDEAQLVQNVMNAALVTIGNYAASANAPYFDSSGQRAMFLTAYDKVNTALADYVAQAPPE